MRSTILGALGGCLGRILEALGGVLEACGAILEALGGVLEALESVLEALDVVLEAMLGQDSPKQAHQSENLEKTQGKSRFFGLPQECPGAILKRLGGSWGRLGVS